MNESEDIRGLQLTLGVYVLIFAMKLVVYSMSGVLALMAEAFHTLSDVFVAGFLLVAAIYSRKKADETYMFGYGRAQNAAALVAATLFVSFTSFELYKEAIPRLFQAEPVTSKPSMGHRRAHRFDAHRRRAASQTPQAEDARTCSESTVHGVDQR
jgi:cation diffusion facilitator family transporter